MKTWTVLGELRNTVRSFSRSTWPSEGEKRTFYEGLKAWAGPTVAVTPVEPTNRLRSQLISLIKDFLKTGSETALKDPVILTYIPPLLLDPFLREGKDVDANQVTSLVALLKKHPSPRQFRGLMHTYLSDPDWARTLSIPELIVAILPMRSTKDPLMDLVANQRDMFFNELSPKSSLAQADDFEVYLNILGVPGKWQETLVFDRLWLRWLLTKEQLSSAVLASVRERLIRPSQEYPKLLLWSLIIKHRASASIVENSQHDQDCWNATKFADPTVSSNWQFEPDSPWANYQHELDECRNYLKRFLIKEVLRSFFNEIAKSAGDPRRLQFWEQYAGRINNIHIAVNGSVYRDMSIRLFRGNRDLLEFLRNRWIEITSSNSGDAILFMEFGQSMIVEVTGTANATFFYQKDGAFGRKLGGWPPKRLKNVEAVKLISRGSGTLQENYSDKEGRMEHRGDWEYRYQAVLEFNLDIRR